MARDMGRYVFETFAVLFCGAARGLNAEDRFVDVSPQIVTQAW